MYYKETSMYVCLNIIFLRNESDKKRILLYQVKVRIEFLINIEYKWYLNL